MAIESLKPTSILAFVIFATWSCAPFITTFILSLTHKNIIGIGVAVYLSLLIGAVLFFDVKYWHPDPQGGIAVLMLPIVFFGIIIGSINLIKVKNT